MENVTAEFNQKIIEHFEHPRNIGEIENPDGFAAVGDPRCGDHIKVWIRVNGDIITDFKYKVFGCWGAIATTSVVSELAIGKSLKDASKITDDDIIRELSGIPENKQHCSILGVQGLRTAIAQYLVNDNHKKYQQRIKIYRSFGYDIPKERDEIIRLIADLPKDISILDIGTGKGHLALAIARTGRKCTSIDISATEIYFAQLNAIYYHADQLIELQQQDARQLKFEDNSFQVIMSAALFHHLANPQPVLEEILRVVKKPGRIIITDLNAKGLQMFKEVHQAEGKDHTISGWSLEKILSWFENRNYTVNKQNKEFETVFVINVED